VLSTKLKVPYDTNGLQISIGHHPYNSIYLPQNFVHTQARISSSAMSFHTTGNRILESSKHIVDERRTGRNWPIHGKARQKVELMPEERQELGIDSCQALT
jgi:hypothetical protein